MSEAATLEWSALTRSRISAASPEKATSVATGKKQDDDSLDRNDEDHESSRKLSFRQFVLPRLGRIPDQRDAFTFLAFNHLQREVIFHQLIALDRQKN